MSFGALVGLHRVAQDAHFLSDVIFAAIFMLVIVELMKMLLLNERPAPRAFSGS